MLNFQIRRPIWQGLIIGIAISWLITADFIDCLYVPLIVFAILIILFYIASKSFYERFAWTLAFQVFDLQKIPLGGIFITVTDMMIVLLLIEAFFGKHLREKRPSLMGRLAVALAIITFISFVFSPVRSAIMGVTARYMILLLLFIALDLIAFPEEALKATRRALAFIFPMALVFYYIRGDLFDIISAIKMGTRPPCSTMLVLYFTCLFPWCLISYRHHIIPFFISCAYALIAWLSQSRVMMFVTFITLVITFFVKLKRSPSPALTFIIILIMSLFGIFWLGGTIMREQRPESSELRLNKAKIFMDVFVEHPFLGTGPGSEMQITRQKSEIQLGQGFYDADKGIVSENGIIECLVETGIIGTALFLAVLYYPVGFCLGSLKRGKMDKLHAGIIMIMLLASIAPLFLGSALRDNFVWLTLAAISKHARQMGCADLS